MRDERTPTGRKTWSYTAEVCTVPNSGDFAVASHRYPDFYLYTPHKYIVAEREREREREREKS